MKKLLTLILAVMLVMAAATGAFAEEGKFIVGAYTQMSGDKATYGMEVKNNLEMAIEYINANGGFNGAEVELVMYDTQGSPEEAVKIAAKLVGSDHADAVIASVNSNEVFASGAFLNDAGVFTMGLGTSASWMAEDWPYVFRASVNNDRTVPGTVAMIAEVGIPTVGCFYGQDDAAVSTWKAFCTECEANGIEVVSSETYDPTDTDYSAQIANVLAKDPKSIYLSVSGDYGALFMKQLREQGFTGMIFAKECVMQSQIQVAGVQAANYVAFAYPYVTYSSIEECNIPIMREYLERYSEKYGELPQTDSAYRAWDTMMIMWEASKIAGANDSDSLKNAIETISDYEGLGGTFDFTKGDREGLSRINAFVLYEGASVPFEEWVAAEGYEAYKAATGNEF